MSEPLPYTPDFITGLRNGDPNAWTQFYNDYKKVLYHFVRQLIKDAETAMDIVADVFSNCWQLKDNFSTVADVRAYMYVSCRNRAYDHLRHAEMLNRHEKSVTETYYPVSENEMDSALRMEIVRAELLQAIHHEIRALPPQLSKIAFMLFVEGKSTGEVAAILSLSPQTVRNSKNIIVKKLQHIVLFKGIELVLILTIYSR